MKKIKNSRPRRIILGWINSLILGFIFLLSPFNTPGQRIERYLRWVETKPLETDYFTPAVKKQGLHERSNIKSIYISEGADSIIILTKDQGAFFTSDASREQIVPFLKNELENKEALSLFFIGNKLHVLLDNSDLIPVSGTPSINIPRLIPSAIEVVFQGNKMVVGTQANGVYVFSREPGIGWISEKQFLAEKSELPSNRIRDLFVASNGVVWIGTDSGLAAYYDGVMINYAPPLKKKKGIPPPPNRPGITFRYEANKILEFGEDRIYVGGKSGVFSVGTKREQIENIRKLNLPYNFNMINDLYIEGATKLWIAGDHLVRYHIFEEEAYDFNLNDSLYKSERAYCLAINKKSNEMWVGTTGSGVFVVPLSLPHNEESQASFFEPHLSRDTLFFSKRKSDFLPVDQFFIMQEVQFGEDDYQITREGKAYLNGLVEKIKEAEGTYQVKYIEIRGHTSKDQRGNEEGNRKLSQFRADTIKQFLVERGIAENKIYAKGFGNELPNPLFPHDLFHPAHRRVEMKVTLVRGERRQ